MTAITPLEFIHKKGIFGDHHKKNESDLLKIEEVKNLTIFQLVQYKNSTINLKDIKIDSLEIPEKNSIVNSNKDTRILWSAPRTWLIYSRNENIIKTIKGRVNDFIKTDKRIKITKIAIKTFCCILFHVLSNSLAAPDMFTNTLLGSLLLRG